MEQSGIFNAIAAVALIVAAASFSSCSGNESSHLLDAAENVIWDRPDSSLSMLESLDTLTLKTKSLKARFSLLYSMALDRNGIDTCDLGVVEPAVLYYGRHGTDADRMKAFYYLATVQYNMGDYQAAVKSYLKADEYSSASDVPMFHGLIMSGISDVYARNHNFEKKMEYSEMALECFTEAGDSVRAWITMGRLASYYADCRNWNKADSLYSMFFSCQPKDSSVLAEHLFNVARYSLFKPDPDPTLSVSMFGRAVNECEGRPSVADYCAYAYALELQGESRAADGIFSQLEALGKDPGTLGIWKYRVSKHRGKLDEALDMFERTVVSQDSAVIATLNQSAVQAQSDYFRVKSEAMEKDRRLHVLSNWLMAFVVVIVLMLFTLVYLHGRRRWMGRMMEMSLINEDVNRRLSEELRLKAESEQMINQMNDQINTLLLSEQKLRNLRRKYLLTYKFQYRQLSDLCNEYWNVSSTSRRKENIYSKVKDIVDFIDGCNQKKLERLIDDNLDGMMRRLRSDFPDSTDGDFRFIALNVLGFDAKTIARVMGYTVQSVYTKRVRFKNRILELPAESRDFYLEFMD